MKFAIHDKYREIDRMGRTAGDVPKGEEMTSVEDYLVDKINQKYAARIFRKLNTEWEQLIDEGTQLGKTEYEWVMDRAMEIHSQLTTPKEKGEVKNEEKSES